MPQNQCYNSIVTRRDTQNETQQQIKYITIMKKTVVRPTKRTEIHVDYMPFAHLVTNLVCLTSGEQIPQYEAVGIALKEWYENRVAERQEVGEHMEAMERDKAKQQSVRNVPNARSATTPEFDSDADSLSSSDHGYHRFVDHHEKGHSDFHENLERLHHRRPSASIRSSFHPNPHLTELKAGPARALTGKGMPRCQGGSRQRRIPSTAPYEGPKSPEDAPDWNGADRPAARDQSASGRQ